MRLTKRGTKYYAVKRVPEQFSLIEERKQVWIALRTDSLSEAQRRAVDVLRDLENQWVASLAGINGSSRRFDALSALAASRGLPYLPAEELATRPTGEILTRVGIAKENETVTAAVLGAEKANRYRLSDLLPIYLELVAVEVKEKGRDQRRIWFNTLKRSMKRLIYVVGNKEIAELQRGDALLFRAYWSKRIQEENLNPSSANREITTIAGVISKLHKLKNIGDPATFRNLCFTTKKSPRPPFEERYIRKHILPALDKKLLNAEASAILKIMINTGMRPSEITGLAPEDIYLDAGVPYVSIRPRQGRELKTQTSIRDIPLVGIALEATKEFPKGFSRYQGKTGAFGQTVNKFLKVNGLHPTLKHCVYSFRHGFQDRLTACEAPDRIQADLMGHRYVRERYGAGPSLAQKSEWLSRVGFF